MQRYSLTADRNIKFKHQRFSLRPQLNQQKSAKVISFVGNIAENINHIMAEVGCCQKCQFRQILLIFSTKLQKLRADRQSLKKKYIEDVHKLQTQVKELQEENRIIKQKLGQLLQQNLSQQTLSASTLDHFKFLGLDEQQISQKTIKSNNKFKQFKDLQQQQKQEEVGIDDKDYESIQKLAFKYNICGNQLQKLIIEYLGIQQGAINSRQQKKLKSLCWKLSMQREKQELRTQIDLFMRQEKGKENCH